MCGIGGYILRRASSGPADEWRRFLSALRSRGPDDEGASLISRPDKLIKSYRTDRTVDSLRAGLPHLDDPSAFIHHDVALLATRYAIVDLGDRGHQPFASRDGSVIGAFNGEIYNHVELRHELESRGVAFRTSCDTEVLVEGYRMWGDHLWNRLNGFWAVALYDRRDATVVFSRDRLGVAPMYYRVVPRGVFFASSIQPLLDVAPANRASDRGIVRGFIATELKDFDESTCFAAVRSFAPASIVRFAPGAFTREGADARRFWTVPTHRMSRRDLPLGEAARRYRDLFTSAVELRLRADVAVAFELSGGLDSSSIVAAAAAAGHDVTTYTLEVPAYNEEPFARSLLSRYRLDYRVVPSTEGDYLDDAKRFTRLLEEPFHAPNIYSHYALRRRIKKDGFSVVLSGSGGDEVLAGYEHDFWPAARAELKRNGRHLEALLCGAGLKLGSWDRITRTVIDRFARVRPRLPWGRGSPPAADAAIPGARPGGLGNGAGRAPTVAERLMAAYPDLSFHERTVHHLTIGQLPYYLRSNDHFSMDLPLEHRLPFLDFRLVELCVQLPVGYLYRAGWTKYILRKAMEPLLPPQVVWRRDKMGFPFPLRQFLFTHRFDFGHLPLRVERAGLVEGPIAPYERLLEDDPLRLWRICSTGLWLDALNVEAECAAVGGREEPAPQ